MNETDNDSTCCKKCGKVYAHRQSLFKHDCGKEKAYTCDKCLKSYGRQDVLIRHKKKCKGTKVKPVCDIRNKVFDCESNLKRHRALHEKETLKCQHCDKTYVRKNRLLDIKL